MTGSEIAKECRKLIDERAQQSLPCNDKLALNRAQSVILLKAAEELERVFG